MYIFVNKSREYGGFVVITASLRTEKCNATFGIQKFCVEHTQHKASNGDRPLKAWGS